MAASGSDLKRWFEAGVASGATHMVVVSDTYDHEDYPVYVEPGQVASEVRDEYALKSMQRVMEVYDLADDMAEQLTPGTRVMRV